MFIVKTVGFTVLYRIGLELMAYLLKSETDTKLLGEKSRNFFAMAYAFLTSFA